METESQKEFRRLLVSEMSRDELEDRLVEYHGYIDELKADCSQYIEMLSEPGFTSPAINENTAEHIFDLAREINKWPDWPDFSKIDDSKVLMYKTFKDLKDSRPELFSKSNNIDWDNFISDLTDYIVREYKNIYDIPREELFHIIVSYMQDDKLRNF